MSKTNSENLLIILVGQSGAGKSTLCRLIGCNNHYYSSSGAIAEALKEKNIDINHDTIHSFANKAYSENPEWQVPQIIKDLHNKGSLILDGPRRLKEVLALQREIPNIQIIRITAKVKIRYERLRERDGINKEEFERILKDEDKETELGQLLQLSDYTISNNGEISELKKEADKVANLIREYAVIDKEETHECSDIILSS